MLNYYNNPTKVRYIRDKMVSLTNELKKYNLFCNKIYNGFICNGTLISIAKCLSKHNGFSKAHAMTGGRIWFFEEMQKLYKK